MNGYGYKVCYKQQGKEKLKIYLITATHDLAEWHIRWYESHSSPENIPEGVIWFIIPVITLKEYKRLWKDCPF